MNMNDLYKQLTKPFTNEIKFRVGESGIRFQKPYVRLLAYVDSRDIEDRLDSVLGFENWEDEYTPISYQDKKNTMISGYICKLTLNLDGKKVTKSNNAEMTNFEGLKGGCSKALVRTASRFGIGRHLYDFKNIYAEISTSKTNICNNYINIKQQDFKSKKINEIKVYWGINSEKIIKEHLENLKNKNINKNKNRWQDIKVERDISKDIIKKLYNLYNGNYEKALESLKIFDIKSFKEIDTSVETQNLERSIFKIHEK